MECFCWRNKSAQWFWWCSLACSLSFPQSKCTQIFWFAFSLFLSHVYVKNIWYALGYTRSHTTMCIIHRNTHHNTTSSHLWVVNTRQNYIFQFDVTYMSFIVNALRFYSRIWYTAVVLFIWKCAQISIVMERLNQFDWINKKCSSGHFHFLRLNDGRLVPVRGT